MLTLNSNTILGVKAFLSDLKYTHGILRHEWDNWPCGAPIVYPDGDDISRKVSVLSLIAPSQSAGGIEAAEVRGGSIVPVNLKPLCGNHKVVDIGELDISKFDRLRDFICDVGGISFVIDSKAGRLSTVNYIVDLSKKFKFFGLFHFNQWNKKHLASEDDKYAFTLTFLDLPYCIPIFNSRRVDGIGLSLSGITLEASVKYGRLHRVFRSDFVFSNYEDNAFVIDGITVNKSTNGENGIIKEIHRLAELELPTPKSSEGSIHDWYLKNIKDREFKAKLSTTSEWNKLVGQNAVGLMGTANEWQPMPSLGEVPEPSDAAPPEPDDSPIVEIIHNGDSIIEFDTAPWEEENNSEMIDEPEDEDLLEEPEEGGN
jgi:hypothetical protein